MKVYLAGPMTGYPDFNFPAFHERAAEWRAEGWDVFSPAESFGGDTSKPYAEYMRHDIEAILSCDALAVLPNWQKSKGASFEVALARMLALPVYDAGTFAPYSETALQEAQRLVYGDRGADYGHPIDDYDRTAALWSTILGNPVTAEQAVLCMVALKISRECNKHKRDNAVDIAGYAECLQRIVEERERRKGAA